MGYVKDTKLPRREPENGTVFEVFEGQNGTVFDVFDMFLECSTCTLCTFCSHFVVILGIYGCFCTTSL